MFTYTIKAPAPVSDWNAVITALFPAFAGEPTEATDAIATVNFATKQPQPAAEGFKVEGEFSDWWVSKDKLTRALATAGKFEAFVVVRDTAPVYARELWFIAPSFFTSDPLIVPFLAAMPAALGMTEEQITALLWDCRA